MNELFVELNQLMVKHRFKPEKRLSQNFVVQPALIESLLAEAKPQKNDVVLEIGAGTGFLTRELIKKCGVVAVEADPKLAGLLRAELPQDNLTILEGDFLSVKLPPFTKVVALPPYAISHDIVFRLMRLDFESAILVFQKEFVDKLTAFPGLGEYNALAALANYFFVPKVVVERINPDNFFPRPQSFSSMVRLTRKNRFKPVKDVGKFVKFVECLFRFKNKALLNSLKLSYPFLKGFFGWDEKSFEQKLAGAKILDEKVYLLGTADFVELYRSLCE